MKKIRRKYDKAFKLEVVRRSLEQTTVKALSEELDIHVGVISKWRKQYLTVPDEQVVFPGNGIVVLNDDERRLQELESALRDKELELEILKKAIGIFSKKDRISTSSLK